MGALCALTNHLDRDAWGPPGRPGATDV